MFITASYRLCDDEKKFPIAAVSIVRLAPNCGLEPRGGWCTGPKKNVWGSNALSLAGAAVDDGPAFELSFLGAASMLEIFRGRHGAVVSLFDRRMVNASSACVEPLCSSVFRVVGHWFLMALSSKCAQR